MYNHVKRIRIDGTETTDCKCIMHVGRLGYTYSQTHSFICGCIKACPATVAPPIYRHFFLLLPPADSDLMLPCLPQNFSLFRSTKHQCVRLIWLTLFVCLFFFCGSQTYRMTRTAGKYVTAQDLSTNYLHSFNFFFPSYRNCHTSTENNAAYRNLATHTITVTFNGCGVASTQKPLNTHVLGAL